VTVVAVVVVVADSLHAELLNNSFEIVAVAEDAIAAVALTNAFDL
jgi:hypothetical protein